MATFWKVSLLVAAAPLLSLPDCEGTKPPRRHFDAPQAAAIAPYGTVLPARVHAFVADNENRAIRTIDLEGRDLEQRIPTGRSLVALLPHRGASGAAERMWAIDRDRGDLVRMELSLALAPTISVAPSFSGAGSVAMADLEALPGRTPTSDWTVTFRAFGDTGRWEVRSVAGVHDDLARTGDTYTADEKEVRFRIRRTGDVDPVDGDTFTFSTDNGLDVIALGSSGAALNLVAAGAGGSDAVLTTKDGEAIAFSLESGLAHQTFALASGAMPGGMESAPDGSALWITDLGNPVVYRLDTTGAPATWSLSSFPMPIAMRDVAVSGDGTRLFTLAADADDVFVHALPGLEPIDLQGGTAGIDPLRLGVAVRALAGARTPVVMRGSGVPAFPILLVTHAGNLFVLNGATGCADYASRNGPQLAGIRFRDTANVSNPSFDLDVFDTSPCGGFVRNENWTLTWSGILDAWEVSGSTTGKQQGLLREGELYTTDGGEITMRVVGDTSLPTDDGDQFVFTVTDGLSPTPVGLSPERPAFAVVGDGEDAREYAIIPSPASDTVAQVNLERRRVSRTYR